MLTSNWLDGFSFGGPFAHWRFDETTGNIAVDAARHALHGTLVNMDEDDWVAGKAGNGLAFDGVDDYVEIAGFLGLLGGQSRTCTAWIKASSSDGVVIGWGAAGAVGGRWVVAVDENGLVRMEVGAGAMSATATGIISPWCSTTTERLTFPRLFFTWTAGSKS